MIKYIVGENMTQNQEYQMFLKQLENTLEMNSHLTDEAKENIFYLVQIMYQEYQIQYKLPLNVNFPTELLLQRLQTLSLVKGTQYIDYDAYHYDINQNQVHIRPELSGCDANTLAQLLLEMAFIKEPNKGMNDKGLIFIKRGMLEMLANHLIGNEGEKGIAEDEQIIINLMETMTNGKILEGFLHDDSAMVEQSIQENDLMIIKDYANYNYHARKKGVRSQLGDIEMRLIVHFFNQNDPKKIYSEMDSFEAQLVSNPNIMNDSSQYMNLEKVKTYFDSFKDSQKIVPFPQSIITEDENIKIM